jgi:hypothetical protein
MRIKSWEIVLFVSHTDPDYREKYVGRAIAHPSPDKSGSG